MFIREKYKIRHEILKALRECTKPYDYTNDFNSFDLQTTLLTLESISQIPKHKILEQIDYLLILNEVSCEWIEDEPYYLILQKGQISLYDNKYLDEGRSYTFRWFKEIITTISIIFAIAISIATLISNYYTTQENAKRLERIEQRLIK